jgi:hypothetical protein
MLGLEGYTVKSAYFTDNARTIVEVVWEHKTEKDEREVLVASVDKDGMPVKEGAAWNNLLNYISIEELHTNTSNYIRAQRLAFEEQIIAIAERDGLTVANLQEDDTFNMIIDIISKEINDESLFKFKLKVFDIEAVKECKDRSVKAEIRKAKSIPEVIAAFSKI